MIDLSVSRQQIDEIDHQIVKLFEKRMQVANEVAKYKMETGKPVLDKEREESKLNNLCALSHGSFNERAVRELFSQIMSISRKYQYGVLSDNHEVTSFRRVETIQTKEKSRVYYFGVPGTHTQQAMEDIFGTDIEGISCQSFQGVMEAVEQRKADFGVLPIENSSTGGITANYDLLLNYKNAIVGQHVMKIDQCLLALPGVEIENLHTVYSHPQGLLQCREFMEKHPHLHGVEYGSTAAAAKKVAQEKDPAQAAIASRRAAEEYGLAVVADSIQQEKNNCTRFIIIAPEEIYTKESNKLALCIELPHKSGSLYRILSHFLYNDLNMTQIESRPIPGKNWEYRFFVDVEGNLEDAAVKNALRGIQEEAAFLRVLGNFDAS
ncbi:MAG: prephenate dehydratase [Lachnospiraceae bacterium]|nr:prephenate dehydratase [Lachnospiraceae bacterium]